MSTATPTLARSHRSFVTGASSGAAEDSSRSRRKNPMNCCDRCAFRAVRGKFNVALCLLITFVSDMGYSVVLPSIYSYSLSKNATLEFYGLIVSVWSFGRVISAPVMGWATSKFSYKSVLLLSLCLALGGDLTYSLAENQWMLLLGRFINGVGSGSKGAIQAYFTENSHFEDRTVVMSKLSVASSLAFGTGPGIGALFSLVPNTRIYRFVVTQLNLPGLFSAVLFFYTLILTAIFFHDQSEARGSWQMQDEIDEDEIEIPFRTPALICFLIIIFLFYPCLVVYETIATPLTIHNFGWTVAGNGVLWLIVAVGCGCTYVLLGIISKKVSDTNILLVNLIIIIVAMGIMTDPTGPVSMWRFVVGSFFMVLSFPMADIVMGSIFSQIIAGNNTGLLFGIYTASGSLAQIIGPIWTTTIYDKLHSGEFWVFLITGSMQVIAFLIYLIIFSKLKKLIHLVNFFRTVDNNSNTDTHPQSTSTTTPVPYEDSPSVKFSSSTHNIYSYSQ